MASILPVQTLPGILILLAVLAPGAAGLYFWWEAGGFQNFRQKPLSLPGLSTNESAGLAGWGCELLVVGIR